MSAVSRRNFISEMRDVYFTVSDLLSRDNTPGHFFVYDDVICIQNNENSEKIV